MSETRPFLRLVRDQERRESRPDWHQKPNNYQELVPFSAALIHHAEEITTDSAAAYECDTILTDLYHNLTQHEVGFDPGGEAPNQLALIIHQAWINFHAFSEKMDNEGDLKRSLGLILDHLLKTQIYFAKIAPETGVAVPSEAFKSLLRIYHSAPDFQTEIETFCPTPTSLEHTVTWQKRAEDQVKLDAIGRALHGITKTTEILERIGPLIRSEIIYANPTIHTRSPMILKNIYERIINYVATYARTRDHLFHAHTSLANKKAHEAMIMVPTFGDHNTPLFVARDTNHEYEKYVRLQTLSGNKVAMRNCDSWQTLLWNVNELIDPDREFLFTVKDPDTGLGTITRLSGKDVRYAVADAPYNRTPATKIPDATRVDFVRPEDSILIEIREALNRLFD